MKRRGDVVIVGLRVKTPNIDGTGQGGRSPELYEVEAEMGLMYLSLFYSVLLESQIRNVDSRSLASLISSKISAQSHHRPHPHSPPRPHPHPLPA